MLKTSYKYILKEVLLVFFIGLMTFTIILLMDKIFKLIELIVAKGANPIVILRLLFFISPSFLIFTIPMSVLLGTLLAFGRLSSDNEVTAFKASGVSLYQLFVPIALLSIVTTLLTSFLVFYGLPWGNRGFRAALYQIAQSKAHVDIQERIFNDDFEDLVVYVDRLSVDGSKMEGVLIYDDRERDKSSTILAREGILINNPRLQQVTLRLFRGDIHVYESKTSTYQKIRFQSYDLNLELAKAFGNIGRKLRDHEMSIDEIQAKIEKMRMEKLDTTPQEVELYKRYAIPFACIVFPLIGVPLGIQPRRSGRSHGFVFSLLILLGYYIFVSAAEILAVRKVFPALVAGWAPNILFAAFGIYLLVRAAKDSPFKPSIWLNELVGSLQDKWKAFFGNV